MIKHNGLECGNCGGRVLAVKDSRRSVNSVRRRRACVVCGTRMTTYEISSPTADDENRLLQALILYDKVRSVPDAQRGALMSMINTLATRKVPTLAPPLIVEPQDDPPPQQLTAG